MATKKRSDEEAGEVAAIAKMVASMDRIWRHDSAATRIGKRASALDVFSFSREAGYALAWLVGTGRLSSESEAKLLALSPRRFATVALAAEKKGTVNDRADVWRAVAR